MEERKMRYASLVSALALAGSLGCQPTEQSSETSKKHSFVIGEYALTINNHHAELNTYTTLCSLYIYPIDGIRTHITDDDCDETADTVNILNMVDYTLSGETKEFSPAQQSQLDALLKKAYTQLETGEAKKKTEEVSGLDKVLETLK